MMDEPYNPTIDPRTLPWSKYGADRCPAKQWSKGEGCFVRCDLKRKHVRDNVDHAAERGMYIIRWPIHNEYIQGPDYD